MSGVTSVSTVGSSMPLRSVPSLLEVIANSCSGLVPWPEPPTSLGGLIWTSMAPSEE